MKADIGKKIRKERQLRGLTIKEMAKVLDISSSYLGLVERGQRCLSSAKLVSFCNLFGVSPEYILIGGVEHSEICKSKKDNIIAEVSGMTEYDLNILLEIIKSYKMASSNNFPYDID